ncbi:Imm52 family immunity protein [Methyloferula stellata]|uniref:Imm52 family immunity protein n=1 Tax=Methyloferula stellata TaxID=876270 RepID=UPI00037B3829|nr:Imm52 family immunity protein [Methyloferula stellata]
MKSLIFGRNYHIRAAWGPRVETPSAMAASFVRYIDILRNLDPVFSLWTTGMKRPVKFETVRDHFEDIVMDSVSIDDDGDPELEYGYGPFACTRDVAGPLVFGINTSLGSCLNNTNYVDLHTNSAEIPDPRIITYKIFKAALLGIVEIWDPLDCRATPHELLKLIDSDGYFRAVWMQYLSPPLARLITPPATSINEYLPNGGLLMSATTETFKVDNPSHVAVACDIADATAPLNEGSNAPGYAD